MKRSCNLAFLIPVHVGVAQIAHFNSQPPPVIGQEFSVLVRITE